MNIVHTDTPSSCTEDTPELETLLPSVSVRTPGNILFIFKVFFPTFLIHEALGSSRGLLFCVLVLFWFCFFVLVLFYYVCWGASPAVLSVAFGGLLGLCSRIHLYHRCAHTQEALCTLIHTWMYWWLSRMHKLPFKAVFALVLFVCLSQGAPAKLSPSKAWVGSVHHCPPGHNQNWCANQNRDSAGLFQSGSNGKRAALEYLKLWINQFPPLLSISSNLIG